MRKRSSWLSGGGCVASCARGFGEGVSALVLDGVLGGHYHERWGQLVADAVDGHLTLLHGLEEGRLGLRGRPVDLVAEDDVGEHGPLPEVELAGRAVPDAHADE